MSNLYLNLIDKTGLLNDTEISKEMQKNAALLQQVKVGHSKYEENLGWLDVEEWAGAEWLSRYEALAVEIQRDADVLVVVGIGGSNQAARAVYEAIGEKCRIPLVWVGNNISAWEIQKVLESIQNKNVYVNVIAKNFETLEPGIGFRVMRGFLRNQYGADYYRRVICTGTEGSHFDTLAKEHGYYFLPFPKNIGGRFSALSSVGLFPLAVAGIDIAAMARGAKTMRARLLAENEQINIALRQAVIRNQLYQKGFRMEMLSFFEPRLFRFSKWWMQLFSESEGKERKGLFPVCGSFSEDLHSIGQFLQEGTHIIFETFLDIKDNGASLILHKDDVDDRFDYLDDTDLSTINRTAFEATVKAHRSVFPCMCLQVDTLDAETFGSLFYYFEFLCYLSARILNVNPFDQPGVEMYKQHMFQALGKE